jgi:hypothetical protein
MRAAHWLTAVVVALSVLPIARAEDGASKPGLASYFPPPESKGGWRTLLPASGDPSAAEKATIAKKAGMDWDKLTKAWEEAALADGSTGLIVIRKGFVVGEWYKDGDKDKAFNIYSSSKSYTSTAYGILLHEMKDGKTPKQGLTLDTKVCNADWLPESLPLSDPRKADITVRELLNMASGIGPEGVPDADSPFETALGHKEKSPFAKLRCAPGAGFNYSNAGVAHLVLLFHNASGEDLYPYLKKRLFDPVGIENLRWQKIGGNGHIGPYSQGFSGIYTTPREHARFCYLSMHRGDWGGQRLVPDAYYDFAWASSKNKADYGGQWWVYPHHKDAPRDLVQTAGALNNHGYVVPSLDLVFVRLGNGKKFPERYEAELVKRVLAAVIPAVSTGEKTIATSSESKEVAIRNATIISEGSRLAAEVFTPKDAGDVKLPAIIMSHGWGGTAQLLRSDATEFARAGYMVVTFDYRGWGDSEGRIVLSKPVERPKAGQPFTAEVREIREVVDPLEQTTDLLNVLHWIQGEKQCDTNRIGLWGSSYSGGHVVYAAARDPRVKATVSQVPALDSRFVTKTEPMRTQMLEQATQRARGEIGYPPPGQKVIGNLRGAPILDKLQQYAPVEDAAKATGCAMLFVLAENEELFDNKEHGILAYERAKGPKKLVILPGLKHYDIYLRARKDAQRLALEWFDQNLKK